MKAIPLVFVGLVHSALTACTSSPQSCFGELERLNPPGAIEPTAQWGLGAKAGPYIFISGMRGIDPDTNEIVLDLEDRVRQAYTNMFFIAASAGAEPDSIHSDRCPSSLERVLRHPPTRQRRAAGGVWRRALSEPHDRRFDGAQRDGRQRGSRRLRGQRHLLRALRTTVIVCLQLEQHL